MALEARRFAPRAGGSRRSPAPRWFCPPITSACWKDCKVNETTWRFKLQENATFSDGAPFNAETAAAGRQIEAAVLGPALDDVQAVVHAVHVPLGREGTARLVLDLEREPFLSNGDFQQLLLVHLQRAITAAKRDAPVAG